MQANLTKQKDTKMAKENIDMHNLYDLDMERAILASIIYSADNLSEIFDIISPFDFYLRAHGDVYDAMVKCLNENLHPNPS